LFSNAGLKTEMRYFIQWAQVIIALKEMAHMRNSFALETASVFSNRQIIKPCPRS
jgi:hypothetical protein